MPIPQTKNLPEKPSFKWSYGFLVLVAAVVAAVILRVWQWVSPGHPVPLLAPAEGLVQAASVPEAEQVVAHGIPMPSDLAGSDIAVVGVYTKAAENIAAGSVAIELKRNDWRFAEIFEQPVALDAELARWNLLPHEPIVLSPSVQGQLFDLGRRYTQCIGGTDTDPGVCQLTHLLIFPLGDLTVTLGADDTHASDGELITLAKSMLPPGEVAAKPVVSHGQSYSAEQAGIASDFDSTFDDLAYIRTIESRDGKLFLTIDPITWVDCRAKPVDGCENGGLFVIQNDDTTTQTLEMSENAGPFFISYEADQLPWKTMDLPTMQGLLNGTIDPATFSPEYYAPFLSGEGASIFHIEQTSGMISKVIQKYLP